jgi:hypothetical protein
MAENFDPAIPVINFLPKNRRDNININGIADTRKRRP